MKKKVIYTIDGKPAKLRDVSSSAQDAMLKEALGDYISARETSNKAGIKLDPSLELKPEPDPLNIEMSNDGVYRCNNEC